MELRHARYFLAVAEELNFTRAAARLHVAQSALSLQVRDLEHELGVALFERTSRQVRLTAAGRTLRPEAQRLVEQAAGLLQRARAVRDGVEGEVRVGLIPPAATGLVAAGLRRFSQARPQVRLTVEWGMMDPLLNRLGAGELDVVVGRPPPRGGGWQYAKLVEERQGLAVPEGHPLATREAVRWRDLAAVRVLLVAGNPHFGQLVRERCAAAGVEPVYDSRGRDLAELTWLVAAGLGVCPFSPLLRHQLPPGAVFRPWATGAPRLTLGVVRRSGAAGEWSEALTRALREAAAEAEAEPAGKRARDR